MTTEQIEQGAEESANKTYPYATTIEDRMLKTAHKEGFIAGAKFGIESRQPEIDELAQALLGASMWIVSREEFNSVQKILKKHIK